eukprot:scaffold8327_cov106-Isochrysis_galbana.AAC.4
MSSHDVVQPSVAAQHLSAERQRPPPPPRVSGGPSCMLAWFVRIGQTSCSCRIGPHPGIGTGSTHPLPLASSGHMEWYHPHPRPAPVPAPRQALAAYTASSFIAHSSLGCTHSSLDGVLDGADGLLATPVEEAQRSSLVGRGQRRRTRRPRHGQQAELCVRGHRKQPGGAEEPGGQGGDGCGRWRGDAARGGRRLDGLTGNWHHGCGGLGAGLLTWPTHPKPAYRWAGRDTSIPIPRCAINSSTRPSSASSSWSGVQGVSARRSSSGGAGSAAGGAAEFATSGEGGCADGTAGSGRGCRLRPPPV